MLYNSEVDLKWGRGSALQKQYFLLEIIPSDQFENTHIKKKSLLVGKELLDTPLIESFHPVRVL